jgi:hypothetical protein
VRAVQREAQKIDRFRALPAVPARMLLREPTKFDQFGLGRFERKAELAEPFAQSFSEAGLTSRVRTSAATAPRLPAEDQDRIASLAGHETSRFPRKERPHMPGSPTHAGLSGTRARAPVRSCLPRSETRQHPGFDFFRGSMAGLCAPLPMLRRHPRRYTAWGRGGLATPSSWRTCTPYSLPVSRRTQIKFKLLHLQP